MPTNMNQGNSALRLSIVIPVYNVADYIEKCVRSLQAQDIPKEAFELIIINDGSPDNSKEVVLGLMNEFNNIVFIDQVNKGVSMARNAGIEMARGQYLLFIDPDDYVVHDSFCRILKAADQYQAEICFLGYRFLNVGNTVRKEILFEQEKGKLFKGTEMYAISRVDGSTDPDKSVAILFNREFMNGNGVRYIANIPYLEDGELLARVFCLAERCIFEGNPFYIRTTRPGSATNSTLFNSEKAIIGFVTAAVNLKNFNKIHDLNQDQKDFINQPIAKFTLLAVQSCGDSLAWKFLLMIRKSFHSSGLKKLSLKGVLYPYTIYARIYNGSIFLFYGYWIYKRMVTSAILKGSKLSSLNK